MPRVEVSPDQWDAVLASVKRKLEYRIAQKGPLSFTSNHEILGVVTEEFEELKHAIHEKKRDDKYNEAVREELLDVAVACIFGLASQDAGGMDW